MIVTAAHRTASIARALRTKQPARRALPRQVYPKHLEGSYSQVLRAFVDRRLLPAFHELEQEIPKLLASAVNEARVDGFRADAGEGKRIRELMRQARERMNRSLNTPELESLAEEFARKTSTAQRIQLARQTKAALGADVFMADRRLASLSEAFVDANVGLITKLGDEVSGRIETSVLRAVQDAKPWSVFSDELKAEYGFSDRRAELIARDQIGKFYGQVNSSRQRELGVSKFVWRSSGDERVRDEHQERNGNTYSYDDPPDGELPGEPVLCRCSAEPDFSEILGLSQ